MNQNDTNRRLCVNNQLKDQLKPIKRALPKRKRVKRKTKQYATLGEALQARKR